MRLRLPAPAILALSLLPALAAAEEKPGEGFAGVYPISKSYTPPRDPAALAKLARFQDLKFGFFMHWGAYSQWGIDASWSLCPERYDWNRRKGEHANDDDLTYKKAYEALKLTFDPVKFDPDRWADIAADAGMRYVVYTTKHHDGFAMWDTKTTDYRITAPDCPFHTNPKADTLKAVFEAFRKKGFWTGAYFSKPDWNTPSYWSPQFPLKDRNANYDPAKHQELWAKFKDFTWSQIREIMTGYGPVDILWLDGGQVQPRDNRQDIDMAGIAAMSRKLQPGLLVVDRTAGGGYEDYLTPEGTHAMPKRYLPYPWEACMTLGEGWAYKPHCKYHGAGEIVRYLVKAVARNGNLLLDVGPMPTGELPPETLPILKDIGAWLKVNGEAIYGTRPAAPYEAGDLFFTRQPDGTRYAIVLGKDDAATPPASVTLPAAIAKDVLRVTLLGAPGELTAERRADGSLTVALPAALREAPPSRHAVTLKLAR